MLRDRDARALADEIGTGADAGAGFSSGGLALMAEGDESDDADNQRAGGDDRKGLALQEIVFHDDARIRRSVFTSSRHLASGKDEILFIGNRGWPVPAAPV